MGTETANQERYPAHRNNGAKQITEYSRNQVLGKYRRSQPKDRKPKTQHERPENSFAHGVLSRSGQSRVLHRKLTCQFDASLGGLEFRFCSRARPRLPVYFLVFEHWTERVQLSLQSCDLLALAGDSLLYTLLLLGQSGKRNHPF